MRKSQYRPAMIVVIISRAYQRGEERLTEEKNIAENQSLAYE